MCHTFITKTHTDSVQGMVSIIFVKFKTVRIVNVYCTSDYQSCEVQLPNSL
jgi:hypothetical protein